MKESKSIGSRVKSGYLWTLLNTGIGQPLSFVFGIVLARILDPADFGLIAACLIFTEVGSTLVSSGFVSGLVQKKETSSLDFSSIFFVQLICSLVLAGLFVLTSPLIARILGNALIGPVLSLLSLNLIILSFCGVPTAKARRALNFRLLTGCSLAETVMFGGVSIGLAVFGYGVWSLVVGKLLGRLLYAVCVSYGMSWRPRLAFSRASVVSLLRISAQFAGKNMLDDITKNVDYLIIGRTLGMTSLGFYSRAYNLMTLPVTKLSMSLGTVLFPAFSKIQDEKERLLGGMLKSTCLISMTTFPVLVSLQILAPLLIVLIYGAKWAPTIVPLQIICIAGLFYTIDSPAVSLINAKGYLMDEIRRQAIHLVLLVTCVLIGSQWGLSGVAVGVSVAAVIYWLLLLQLLKKRIDLSLRAYFQSLIPASLASFTMAVVVTAFVRALSITESEGNLFLLFGMAALCGVTYLVSLWGTRQLFHQPVITGAFDELSRFLVSSWNKVSKSLSLKWQNP